MPRSKKVAVSLPAALLEEMERARRAQGDTRSAFVRKALERAFEVRAREARLASYADGYRRAPETEREVEAAAQAAVRLLSEEPWDAGEGRA